MTNSKDKTNQAIWLKVTGSYGYGNQEELTQAGAWKIAETVEEIEEILEGK